MRWITKARPVCEFCGTRANVDFDCESVLRFGQYAHRVHMRDGWSIAVHSPAIVSPPSGPTKIDPFVHASEVAQLVGQPIHIFACPSCAAKIGEAATAPKVIQ